jgi:type IV pilus assembly protein PilA
MKTKVTLSSGFTLVEIMIVVAIVAMLSAIAVPAFAKNRAFSRRSACMANLKQIESAKIVWAQENRKGNVDEPVDSDLFGPNNYLRSKPQCPADGKYSLNPVDTRAGCSLATIEGHTL